jgi:hypothetical protein
VRDARKAVDADDLALDILDQARAVVARDESRADALEESPLGEFEQLLNNLRSAEFEQVYGRDADPSTVESIIPEGLSVEQIFGKFVEAFRAGDKYKIVEALRLMVLNIKDNLREIDLAPQIEYNFNRRDDDTTH